MSPFLAGSATSIIPLASTGSGSGCAPVTRIAAPVEGEAPVGVRHVALMLTRKCNMSCAHCSVESSPNVKGEPTADELSRSLREAHESGVRSILLTGGEPMIREKIVFDLLKQAQQLGMMTSITTNGFWGKSPQKAEQTVARLKAAGLSLLTISYDRYHAEYQGPEPSVNIARATTAAGLGLNVSITRTADEADLDAIMAPFALVPKANLRVYDVQLVGRARQFETETLRDEVGGFCSACGTPAITDDGRVTACNGPSYFEDAGSPLIVGRTGDEELETLLRRHRQDPILEAIRVCGPLWLLGELERMPGFEAWARPHYGGTCDLCLHLNSDPAVTAKLREHLASPRLAAEFVARRQVIEAARGCELNRAKVNGPQIARVWWNAMKDVTTLRDADNILGRADLNWREQTEYLIQCGLARPLLEVFNAPEFKRWAPDFVGEKLRHQAMLDAMRLLMQRDALREIADSARTVGASGVLLKGAAMWALDEEEETALRSGCDIDVYFAPDVAARVHAQLVERGFVAAHDESKGEAARRHQLPALVRGAVWIEIHQTLLAPRCGAPDRAMLRKTRRLSGALDGLRVLGPEAMLLYNMLHCSKHNWIHGLKAAYDAQWILRHFPDLNWNWLARLVARTGLRRGFWVPFVLLTRELELPVPAWFLKLAPSDARQRKLERLAEPILFSATNAWFSEKGLIYHATFLLQSDRWLFRARYLLRIARGKSAIESRAGETRHNPTNRRESLAKFGNAVRGWRRM